MKYEAVFGNQELFDGAGTFTGLDVVVHSIASGIKSYARLSDLTPESLRNHPVCAMRRIIKEPKRWTVADQNAGKLPEVGSMLNHKTRGECTFIGLGVDDKTCWALKLKNDLIYIADKNWCTPIESPEEKVARLREEWVDKATFMTTYEIYDQLLSGDLPVPVKE